MLFTQSVILFGNNYDYSSNIYQEYLIKNNIECGIHYKPNHLLTKYKIDYALVVTERIYNQIITLPCHYDLTNEEQSYIIDKIKDFYGQ